MRLRPGRSGGDGRAGAGHGGAAVGSPGEDEAIERVYADLPSVSFSDSVLATAPGSLGVIRLASTDWSDWGNVRRVVESLRRTGRRPYWLSQAESMLIA